MEKASALASRKSAGWSQWKTPLFLLLVILSNLTGDVCLRFGLRHAGNLLKQSIRADVHAVLSPWVLLGMSFYFIWMLSQMALFSWADLSYVLPIASIGYALAAIAGRLLLGETVSSIRWLGFTVIIFGVFLVTRTPARTVEQGRRRGTL